MIHVSETNLWLGNSADLRDMRSVLNTGVTAIIDLAVEEPVPLIPRTTNYCRFLITDDGENDPATLRAAISVACHLLAGGHELAICCNAGLNRSPSLGAIVLAWQTQTKPSSALEIISKLKHIDVNPALWGQLLSVYSSLTIADQSSTS